MVRSVVEPKTPSEDAYLDLFDVLSRALPRAQLITDPLRTFAYGTDASFYRLIPKLVVRVRSEEDVIATVRACSARHIPYTFRAAGTSLSGQAVSDSVLIQVSRVWNKIEVSSDGSAVRLDPAVLGGDANRALIPFGRRIGPDPASIDSAMIGGIAANNSSGMCCGNTQDSYRTMRSLRAVLAGGAILDTHSVSNRHRSYAENRQLLEKLEAIANDAKSDAELRNRIRQKYAIKNTTGYSLNALLEFSDPLDIASHLLIGSEGTLGFISSITYNTVVDPKHRATALVLFPDVVSACNAAYQLSKVEVAAVELMDHHSLRAVAEKPGVPREVRSLPENVAGLLVEVHSETKERLATNTQEVSSVLSKCFLHCPYEFTSDSSRSKQLWLLRKGLFPSLGNVRVPGSTILIEDVAFPSHRLGEAALDLRKLFNRYGYHDAVIFGHALQGNLHFVFCVDFNRDNEIKKYGAFLDELTDVVTKKYDGSLKAEHGTGRNMAPFVEKEWGQQAYSLMCDIKAAFDPHGLMNPGVIITDDKQIHISNLKRTPLSNPIIEKCTECGFCERTCPSRHVTLTPRQRISVWREISSLEQTGCDRLRLKALKRAFRYAGEATCATDSLCASLCPLDIDTGRFVKQLRESETSLGARVFVALIASRLGNCLSTARLLLRVAWLARQVLGKQAIVKMSRIARTVTRGALPEWSDWIPQPASAMRSSESSSYLGKVVYFPSCVSRLFGHYGDASDSEPQTVAIKKVLERAGFSVVVPAELSNLCCGMAFSSKGFSSIADRKLNDLKTQLEKASEGGKYPIVVDTSPCARRVFENVGEVAPIFDVSEFILREVLSRVPVRKLGKTVAVHVPCSLRKAGKDQPLIQLANLCAERVIVPEATPCCGFAGDRGFTHPELTASALIELKPQVHSLCSAGYSTSRTCEIGLSVRSGVAYQSIAYLVEEAMDLPIVT